MAQDDIAGTSRVWEITQRPHRGKDVARGIKDGRTPPVPAITPEHGPHLALPSLTISQVSPSSSYVIFLSAFMRLFMQKYFYSTELCHYFRERNNTVARDDIACDDACNIMPPKRNE